MSKPVDMARANGVLFYNVPNRGNGAPNPTAEGEVSVVSGWPGDLSPRAGRQTINVPVAKNRDRSTITGPVFEGFIDMTPGTTTLDLGTAPYSALTYQRPLTLDTTKASLTKRSSADAPGATIARDAWAFADCSRTPFPGEPNPG
jgi:hypothetical protein